jgi:hypothetical protein
MEKQSWPVAIPAFKGKYPSEGSGYKMCNKDSSSAPPTDDVSCLESNQISEMKWEA